MQGVYLNVTLSTSSLSHRKPPFADAPVIIAVPMCPIKWTSDTSILWTYISQLLILMRLILNVLIFN
jgi:hypothetical protein